MKNAKRFLSVLLCVALCMSLCVNVFAANEDNELGIVFSATVDNELIYASGSEQTVIMTVNLSKEATVDSIGYVVVAPTGWAVADPTVHGEDLFPNSQWDWDAEQNSAVGMCKNDVTGVTTLCQVVFTVPADVEIGEYVVGVQEIYLANDGGVNEWETSAESFAHVEVECAHDYGDLVTESPATHTPEKLEGGMKAHYFCNKCSTYFDAGKKETTENALIIPAPSHDYNETVWVKGDNDHWHQCECGAKSDVEEHKGGTATCKEYAICSVCDKPYGSYADHEYGALIKKVDATHTPEQLLPGKKAHYKCSVCEKFFDENKQEVEESALTIPEPTHSFGSTWTSGNSQHWHACACGAKKDVANCEDKKTPKDNKCDTCDAIMCVHASIISVDEVGEDCDTDGVKAHHKCEACGAKFSDAEGKNSVTDEELKIPAHHTLGEWNEEVPAQCEQTGTEGYYHCSVCNKNFDADGKTEIVDLTIRALEHDCTLEGGSTATCIAKAKCGRCGKEYGETDENKHAGPKEGEIKYNDLQHWGICQCDKPLTPEDHKGGTATCVAKAECEVCHQLYGEVNANAHVWKEIERLEATKEAEGWIKYECELNAQHTKTDPIPKLPSDYAPATGPSKEETEQPGEDTELTMSFADVTAADWFFDTVKYTYENGLMNGTSETTFAPYANTSRAMIVTILWRLEGEPAPQGNCQFVDVPANTWYTKAVTWAAEKGIVNGVSATEFGPDANITREQFATILYRYAKNYKGYDVSVGEDTNILSYTDAMVVSEYAVPAMQWACGAGLINGIDGALQPAGFANRAQAATILARFCQNVK